MMNSRILILLCGMVGLYTFVLAEEHSLLGKSKPSLDQRHMVSEPPDSCRPEKTITSQQTTGYDGYLSQFEGLQIETSDITQYETFFEMILHADRVEKIDHPKKDSIRGYCFRDVRIVVRQDFQHPRPTGWVQINFDVPNAQSIYDGLQKSIEETFPSTMSEEERHRVARLKLKPEVTRGRRKAIRLEVYGPEGFLLGFNQYMGAP